MIHVAIDLTPLMPVHSGVDTFLRELLLGLGRVDSRNRYTVFLNREDANRFAGRLGESFQLRPWCRRPRPFRLVFQQCVVPPAVHWLNVDVLHSTSFLAPYIRGRQRHLLTVQDMTFFSHPATHNALHRTSVFRKAVEISIRRADCIHVPSESTRSAVMELAGRVPTLRVVPHGVGDEFSVAPAEPVERMRARLGLPDRYILYVGTIEPRKNILGLLEAYASLDSGIRERYKLVLAGQMGWNSGDVLTRIARPDLQGRVDLTGYVSQENLPWLYRAASVFVYPSLYEGFGLPPLEAMACGTPVVATRVASLEENLTGAADLAPPGDSTALAASLKRLLTDPGHSEKRRREGLERASRFRWDQAALGIRSIYEELGSADRRSIAGRRSVNVPRTVARTGNES